VTNRYVCLTMVLFITMLSPVRADESPTLKGTVRPTPSEAKFVKAMQADLNRRFASPAAAEAAGYFRYTNADDTGAISYANLHWASSDVHHPSQLWFDKRGNLLGADYSIPKTSEARPRVWGIEPGRWAEFDDHIHYVTKDPATGVLGYDKYVDPVSGYVAAGGDPKHPDAAILVKMHRVPSTDRVAKIFDFPSLWDLIVWIKPNPNGAFADKNPLVKV
jgi:hypothetical protein